MSVHATLAELLPPAGTPCHPCSNEGHHTTSAVGYVAIKKTGLKPVCAFHRDGVTCPDCARIEDRMKRTMETGIPHVVPDLPALPEPDAAGEVKIGAYTIRDLTVKQFRKEARENNMGQDLAVLVRYCEEAREALELDLPKGIKLQSFQAKIAGWLRAESQIKFRVSLNRKANTVRVVRAEYLKKS